jgi:hypothetical protein
LPLTFATRAAKAEEKGRKAKTKITTGMALDFSNAFA